MNSLTYSQHVLDDGDIKGAFEHASCGFDPHTMGGPTMEVHAAIPEDELFPLFLSRFTRVCFVGSLEALSSHPFSSDVVAKFPNDEVGAASGGISSTLVQDALGDSKRVFVVTPATICSRHNSPARPDSVTELLLSGFPTSKADDVTAFVVAPSREEFSAALILAIGKVFPAYSRKSSGQPSGKIDVFYANPTEPEVAAQHGQLLSCMRHCAAMVDAPASELTTTMCVAIARDVASKLLESTATYSPPAGHAISCEVTTGEALRKGGFGGIYGVGQAATHPPSMVVLGAKSTHCTKTVVMVGKGIVYDTGGLSIKTKEGMPGMKTDMGGMAAVLNAFDAAVRADLPTSGDFNLYAILCLAENSVGPCATRPDDIHTMFSGKTVEINNTDAEGRLVSHLLASISSRASYLANRA